MYPKVEPKMMILLMLIQVLVVAIVNCHLTEQEKYDKLNELINRLGKDYEMIELLTESTIEARQYSIEDFLVPDTWKNFAKRINLFSGFRDAQSIYWPLKSLDESVEGRALLDSENSESIDEVKLKKLIEDKLIDPCSRYVATAKPVFEPAQDFYTIPGLRFEWLNLIVCQAFMSRNLDGLTKIFAKEIPNLNALSM